jgi:fructokinase
VWVEQGGPHSADDSLCRMLTVLGEALIDLIPEAPPGQPDSTRYNARVGGSPFNVAIGLARLGQPTEFMARLSGDSFGSLLRRHLEANHVGLAASPRATQPTTLAVAQLDEQGRAFYDFYREGTADWQWTGAELAALPPDTVALHTGSLASWLAPGAGEIAVLVQRMRIAGSMFLSYDPNIRPDLFTDRSEALPMVERSIGAAHLTKASTEDIEWLYPDQSLVAVARRWLDLGTELVVITRGGDGLSAFNLAQGRVDQPGVPVTVVDTIGAGDACMAALLDGFSRQGSARPRELVTVSTDRLKQVLSHAALVAAMTCARPGADPPTAAEVAAARDQ